MNDKHKFHNNLHFDIFCIHISAIVSVDTIFFLEFVKNDIPTLRVLAQVWIQLYNFY